MSAKTTQLLSSGEFCKLRYDTSSSSSSIGATARCGLWPVEQYLSIFPYLSPTISIFSLQALEDLFLLLLLHPFLGLPLRLVPSSS
jgi:hypothetical protein